MNPRPYLPETTGKPASRTYCPTVTVPSTAISRPSTDHRGGKAEKIKLTPEERSTAVRAAQILGLKVAGVDILRSNHGPVVMEVNSSPGLEGIEKTSEVDVADAIIQFLEKNVSGADKGTDKGDRNKY